jgi:glycerophosphoryl diester phosphodiesterase
MDRSGRHPGIIAHRGASGLASELTLAAVDLALQSDADFIEVDLRATLDGEIVAFHDSG